MASISKQVMAKTDVVTLSRADVHEHFVTVRAENGLDPANVFARLAEIVRNVPGRVVFAQGFGICDPQDSHRMQLRQIADAQSYPVTWVESTEPTGCDGIHLWLVDGPCLKPIRAAGRVVGSVFEDQDARWCSLAGLGPERADGGPAEQVDSIFGVMDRLLKDNGFSFPDLFRTWFYLDHIADWYGAFNGVRNRFFQRRQVHNGRLPASTGIGGPNPSSTAVEAGLLALKPKHDNVRVVDIPSVCQPPAPSYGSAFSRAVEVVCPDHRRLYVSGTASIDEAGRTIFADDAAAQVAYTLKVVGEILSSRDMIWADVTRSVAYFKRADDLGLLAQYCRDNGLEHFPVIAVQNEICRDDLLFEIELDAVRCG